MSILPAISSAMPRCSPTASGYLQNRALPVLTCFHGLDGSRGLGDHKGIDARSGEDWGPGRAYFGHQCSQYLAGAAAECADTPKMHHSCTDEAPLHKWLACRVVSAEAERATYLPYDMHIHPTAELVANVSYRPWGTRDSRMSWTYCSSLVQDIETPLLQHVRQVVVLILPLPAQSVCHRIRP